MWCHCFGGNLNDVAARKAVEERIERRGPVPRPVLAQIDEEREELEETIAAQRVSALRDLVQTRDDSERVAVRDVSFRIVHYKISSDYRRVLDYDWASPYVALRVAEVLEAREGLDRFALLASMLRERSFVGMSGELFESWSDLRMSHGGTFRIRRLGVGSEEVLGEARA
jgi:hypothetical protein